MLERTPDPLRGELGFMPDVKADKAERLGHAGGSGLCRRRAREVDQGVGSVELPQGGLVFIGIKDMP